MMEEKWGRPTVLLVETGDVTDNVHTIKRVTR